jgi:hypothetical protein
VGSANTSLTQCRLTAQALPEGEVRHAHQRDARFEGTVACAGRKPHPPDFKPDTNLGEAPDCGRSNRNVGCDALRWSQQSQTPIRIPH